MKNRRKQIKHKAQTEATKRRRHRQTITSINTKKKEPNPRRTKLGAMDDVNIVNDYDDNEDQQEADDDEQEQHEIAAAAAATQRHLKINSVLERKGKFPLRNRNKIDVLIKEFLLNLGDDIHDMLYDTDINSDNYRGLDSDRDTEEEVETAIHFFPEVLLRPVGGFDDYPIQLLSYTCYEDGYWGCNVKAVSFIPIVARLAIEFGLSFDGEEERGGLLCEDIDGDNALQYLTANYKKDYQNHETIDNKYLQVFIQLRNMGLLKKEDIQRYGLLQILCNRSYFPEKRFRFFVEWDPITLTQTCGDGDGDVPPHDAAYDDYSIRAFQLLFEYGIRYFPKKKGINLLFRKNCIGKTPFQLTCEKFGYEKVMEVVEDTLIRCYSSSDDTPPLNIEEALMTAATDKDSHLDCVYFLLRRQPDVLQKLLSPLPYKSKLRKRKRKL